MRTISVVAYLVVFPKNPTRPPRVFETLWEAESCAYHWYPADIDQGVVREVHIEVPVE